MLNLVVYTRVFLVTLERKLQSNILQLQGENQTDIENVVCRSLHFINCFKKLNCAFAMVLSQWSCSYKCILLLCTVVHH